MDVKMTEANRGPAINCQPYRNDAEMDVSFRVLAIYDVKTDGCITRLDVLLNAERPGSDRTAFVVRGDQFNSGVYSTAPGDADLPVPKGGILGGLSIRASGKDLSISLRALADAIDRHMKARE